MTERSAKPSYFSMSLRVSRLSALLSQQQLALASGCSKSHVANMEAGRRGASPALKSRLREQLTIADGRVQRALDRDLLAVCRESTEGLAQ